MHTLSSKKKSVIISIICVFAVCFIFGILVGTHVICIFHKWNPATCTDAEICAYCEKTRNEAFGHTWNEATCIEPKTCATCGDIEGTAKGHEWIDATCTDPKNCVACGEVEGEALGHEWADATCENPQICSGCGATEGVALGHSWKDATCSAPQTCSTCGQTKGEAKNHIPGEWEYEYRISAGYYTMQQSCKTCGETLESEIGFYSTMYSGNKFIFTPEEFSDRLDGIFAVADYPLSSMIEVSYGENELLCAVTKSNELICAIMFSDEDKLLDNGSKDKANIGAIMTYFYTDDPEDVVETMIGIIITCDPTLEISDARAVGSAIVSAAEINDSYKHNGITYGLTVVSGNYVFAASLLPK